MLNRIEEILKDFRGCFTRRDAYKWFVILVIGIMIRSDKLGVTSVVRDLALRAGSYESMIRFFHASSWYLPELWTMWRKAVYRHAPLYRYLDRVVIVGDGVMQAKEGVRMPGVKRLKQSSETQSKAERIHGHLWGCVGILIGKEENPACLPLHLSLHDGLRETADWEESEETGETHVERLVYDGCKCSITFGPTWLLLDRLYPSVKALCILKAWNAGHPGNRVDMISRLKRNAVAWTEAPERVPGQRGRRRKKGDKIRLWDLFETRKSNFQKEYLRIRGKKTAVQYYTVDLLWGKGLYEKLRFVFVRDGDGQMLLFSTNLSLSPADIICLYYHRPSVECTFRQMKQSTGAFDYHFWSKVMPVLNRFRKKTDPAPLANVTSPEEREQIMKTVRATELYVLISSVAIGILQILSIEFDTLSLRAQLRYQRTPSGTRISESNVMSYLRRHIFTFMESHVENTITQLIRSAQERNESGKRSNVA